MLELARRRCAEHENVSFHEGEVLALPVEDGTFDRALSAQVLEYVELATEALVEIQRALRPGGRVVIWDIDWATVSWHSSDPDLTEQILRAWDQHLAHPTLPRSLGPRLRQAGFEEIDATGRIFTTIKNLDPEAYGGAIIPIIANYVRSSGLIDEARVEEWVADQHRLSDRGEFYFASVQFCFTGVKPE
jgi:SAM-dependent methyltransferase